MQACMKSRYEFVNLFSDRIRVIIIKRRNSASRDFFFKFHPCEIILENSVTLINPFPLHCNRKDV